MATTTTATTMNHSSTRPLLRPGGSSQLARPRLSTSARRSHAPQQTALPPLPGTCCRRRPQRCRRPAGRTARSAALPDPESGSGGDEERDGEEEDEGKGEGGEEQQQQRKKRWTPLDPAVAAAAAAHAALRGAAAAAAAGATAARSSVAQTLSLPAVTSSKMTPAEAAARLAETTGVVAAHLGETLAKAAARAWLLLLACLAPPAQLLSTLRSQYARSRPFRNACKFLAVAAGSLMLAQLWVDAVLVPGLNDRRSHGPNLGRAEAAISAATGRSVHLGSVRGVYPGRLVSRLGRDVVVVGPVRVGPGPAEASSAEVERVAVSLGLGFFAPRGGKNASGGKGGGGGGGALRTKVHLRCEGASVDLVQGGNLSWAGYPDDMEVEVEGKAVAGAGAGAAGALTSGGGNKNNAAAAATRKVVVSARDWLPGLSGAAAPAALPPAPGPSSSSSSSSSSRSSPRPPPPPFAWISPSSSSGGGKGKGKGKATGGAAAAASAAAPATPSNAASDAASKAAADRRSKSIWGSSAPVFFEFDDDAPLPAKASTAATTTKASSSSSALDIQPVSRGLAGMTSSTSSLKGGDALSSPVAEKKPAAARAREATTAATAAAAPAPPAPPVVAPSPPSTFPKDVRFSFDDGGGGPGKKAASSSPAAAAAADAVPSPSSVAATAARAAADTAARLRAKLEAAVARKEERATAAAAAAAAKRTTTKSTSSSPATSVAAASPAPPKPPPPSSLIENMSFEFSDAEQESGKKKKEEERTKKKKEKLSSSSSSEARARVAAADAAADASTTEQPSSSAASKSTEGQPSSGKEEKKKKENFFAPPIDLGTFELPPVAPATAAADAAAVAASSVAAAPAAPAPAPSSASAAATSVSADPKPRRHAPAAAARPAAPTPSRAASTPAPPLSPLSPTPQSTYRPAEAPLAAADRKEGAGEAAAPWWVPSPVLSSVSLRDASLRVHFAGDAPAVDEKAEASSSSTAGRGRRSRHPRLVEGISARLRLSADYDSLDLELSGTAHERGPEADRCTMPPALAAKKEKESGSKKAKTATTAAKAARTAKTAAPPEAPPPPPVRSLRAAARRAPIVQDAVTPPDAEEVERYAAGQRAVAASGAGGFLVADASTTAAAAAAGEGGRGGRRRWLSLPLLRPRPRPDGDLVARPTGGKLGVRVSARNLLSLFAASKEESGGGEGGGGGVASGAAAAAAAAASTSTTAPSPSPTPPPSFPELVIAVRGEDLHVPLLERVLDVPIDAYSGRVSGEVVVSFAGDDRRGVAAEDAGAGSWAPGALPHLSGHVRGHGLDFHFWGSPDDCEDVEVELAIEGDTLFFQRARGRFGAAPLDVTGEVRLDGGVARVFPADSDSASFSSFPSSSSSSVLVQTNDGGRYRLAADVSGPGGVEVNALRETLGLRPLPVPVAGAVAGSLRVSGRLEEPVFSGMAYAVRPLPQQQLLSSQGGGENASSSSAAAASSSPVEPSEAQDALLSAPAHAVGAYDRVPVASAEAVFSMDTAADLFTLHSLRASPLLSNDSNGPSESGSGGGGENSSDGGSSAASSSSSTSSSPSTSSILPSYGTITGSGVISVSPQAETDPAALRMEFKGRDIPADALLAAYQIGGGGSGGGGGNASASAPAASPLSLISGTSSPSLLGLASGSATLTGSHVDASLRAQWEAPDASARGTVELSREAIAAAVEAPALAARARLRVRAPSVEAQKLALTQRAASELARPDVRGVEVEADLRGLDVAPLLLMQAGENGDVSAATSSRLAATTRQRLRLAGTAAFQGAFDDDDEGELEAGGGKEGGEKQLHLHHHRHHRHHHHRRSPKQAFSGKLSLESLRLNSLRLSRTLDGTLKVSRASGGLALHARGLRPDEALDLEVGVPLLTKAGLFAKPQQQQQQEPGASSAAGAPEQEVLQQSESSSSGGSSADEEVEEARAAVAAAAVADAATAAAAAAAAPPGARLNLRCGRLAVAAEASEDLSSVDASARGLSLDGLELASLRGTVDDAAVSVNARAQAGRARLSLAAPRFSGLSGESLAASLRWDRDVLRLERASLTQPRSRYEVSGEYVIPAGTLPTLVNEEEGGGGGVASSSSEVVGDLTAAAATTTADNSSSSADQPSSSSSPSSPAPPPSITQGRWRLQVNVPSAELEELVPGARLLRRAAALAPTDYEAAKAAFLRGVGDARIAASGLAEQLAAAAADVADAFAEAAVAAAEGGGKGDIDDDGEAGGGGERDGASAAAASASASAAEEEQQAAEEERRPAARRSTSSSSSSSSSKLSANLAGLQDLKGTWSGWVTAYGGGGGATAADFDVRGSNWRWGGRSSGDGASGSASAAGFGGASDGKGGGGNAGGNNSGNNSNQNNSSSSSFGGIALLDTAVARGCAHSEEGLRIDEAGLRSGDAAVALRGTLLGSPGTRQDARLLVTDFPVAKLTPALRALVPALSHAAPAAASSLPSSSLISRGGTDGSSAAVEGGGDGIQQQQQQQQQQRSASSAAAATAPERIAAVLGLGRPLAALRSAAGGVLGGGGGGGGSASTAVSPSSSWTSARRGGVFGGGGTSSSSADPSSLASAFSSSPVGGLLYLKASVGGTAADPTAAATARLFDGALGATRLAAADGSATLGADGRLEFSASLEPARGGGGGKKDGQAAAAGGGIVRASGSLPLRSPSSPSSLSTTTTAAAAASSEPLPAPLLAPDEVSIDASVRDGGMTLVAGLAPAGTRWLGGAADVRVRVRGRTGGAAAAGAADAASSSSSSPPPPLVVTAAARVARGGLALPFLRAPATGITADVEVTGDGVLRVRELSGKVGRKGMFSASGALPLQSNSNGGGMMGSAKRGGGAAHSSTASAASASSTSPATPTTAAADPAIVLELDSVDVRARPRYSGLVDAAVSLRGSARAPVVGGHVRLSKGVLSLVPPGEEGGDGKGNSSKGRRSGVLATRAGVRGGASSAAAAAAAAAAAGGPPPPADAAPTDAASSAVAASSSRSRRKKAAAAARLQEQQKPPGLVLRGLDIRLGPELRGVYPFVVNVGLSGGLLADGDPAVTGAAAASPLPLHPGESRAAARARFASRLRLGGSVTLDGGEVNLLATRFVLDREHTNRVTFDNSNGGGGGFGSSGGGFAGVMGFGSNNKKSALGTPPSPDDPALDLVLRGAGMRVAILTPRASAWRQGLTLTAASSSSSSSSSSSAAATAGAAGGEGAADGSTAGGGSVSATTTAGSSSSAASPAATAAARRAAAVAGGGSGGSGGGGGGGSADPLAAEDAARLFEAALARAVVSEDGRLALPALAAAAAHSFMPKIQTQGALGQARWRLVSAPSVAGLFALDSPAASASGGGGNSGDKGASAASYSRRSSRQGGASLLESLALGTEVEVQFGKSLRASLSRPLRDAETRGGGPAACTLTYALTSHVRVQFSVGGGGGAGGSGGGGGAGTGPRSLVVQYSSDVSS